MEWVILKLVAWLAGELPAMVLGRHWVSYFAEPCAEPSGSGNAV
jgi:hypothetical protein